LSRIEPTTYVDSLSALTRTTGRYCAAEVFRGATTLSGGAVAEVHRAAGFDEVVVQAVE
jgi:hypothetical protein